LREESWGRSGGLLPQNRRGEACLAREKVRRRASPLKELGVEIIG
jgi:hypothetical protein